MKMLQFPLTYPVGYHVGDPYLITPSLLVSHLHAQ